MSGELRRSAFDEAADGEGRLFAPPAPELPIKLTERFVVPPLTIMNRGAGYWMTRQRLWDSVIPDSREGRKAELTFNDTPLFVDQGLKSTSEFDPVIAELAYKWFVPPGGRVLDPFAGGSVRGLVAGLLGLEYVGIDLSAEQVEANRRHAAQLWDEQEGAYPGSVRPRWIRGDARDARELAADGAPYDFVFTCPPYWNLEVYTDDPKDLSTINDWRVFADEYARALSPALELLAPDRFFGIVVGNVRDSRGFVQDLRALTSAVARAHGVGLYNDVQLAAPLGSAPQRAARPFNATRKITRMHQDFLVYAKGDPVKAAEAAKQGNEEAAASGADLGKMV